MRAKVKKAMRFSFLVLVAFLFTVAFLKVSILIGNDLAIKLTPLDRSFNINYPQTANASFRITTINAAFCTAECNYTMEDISSGEITDTGIFLLGPQQTAEISYLLGAKPGTGQNIYNFRVECANKPRFFCLSEGHTSSRVALVTLNFEPTEAENALKGELKQNLTQFLAEMAQLDRNIQEKTLQLEYASTEMRTANLSAEMEGINGDFTALHLELENVRTLWHSQNYTYLSKSFNQSYWQTLSQLRERLAHFEEELSETAAVHNAILERAKILKAREPTYEASARLALITSDKEKNETIMRFINELNATFTAIYEKSFLDYGELTAEIERLENNATLIEKDSAQGITPQLASAKYFIFTEYDYLCESAGRCTLNHSLYELEPLWNSTTVSAVHNTETTCSQIEELSRLKETTGESPHQNNPEFVIFQNFTIGNEKIKIANRYAAQKTEIMALGAAWQDLVAPLPNESGFYTITTTNQSILNLSTIETFQGNKTSLHETIQQFNKSICAETMAIELHIFNITSLQNISLPSITVNESTVSTNISDNPPVCCVFGNCRECCTGCATQYPVVFVHGHAIDRMNSPEYSLDTFSKIQRRLQKDGYVNAGIISLSTNLSQFKKGEWGKSGYPVSVKVSYYYDIYYDNQNYVLYPQKTESIEAYAIRLKELIDIVKHRTGQDKVVVIAHSMGGLVTRRYLQIFGEDSVDKIILMGTPNRGIDEELLSYCSIFGGGNECNDMAENSVFIKKINDPAQQPKNVKVYTIAASGCSMKGGNGDGLVLYESAILPLAKNYELNGSCPTFVNLLHAEMVNPDTYPQVYEEIKKILKE